MDISKFSFSEMCSNNDGKTSGSGTMGILVTTIAILCFAYGVIIKNSEIITQSSFIVGIGSGLLLGRKFVNGKSVDTGTDPDSKNDLIPDDSRQEN